MVNAPSLYVFLGQDIVTPDGLSRKESTLNNIKSNILKDDIKQFNFDTIYAKEISLKELQRLFLQLPVNSSKRLLVVKEPQQLKPDCKEFIARQIKTIDKAGYVIVFDISSPDTKDELVNLLLRLAKVFRFNQVYEVNSFTLARQIQVGDVASSLRILKQLLGNAEKPERILGGLRYAWEKERVFSLGNKKRLKLLLDCDLEIKTGRLKSDFALEKLVIKLCGL